VLEYIEEVMPPETPLAFGLHPNAEIGFKLREAETFCTSLVQLQPREAGGEGGLSSEEKAKMVLDDVMERLPEQFDMEEVRCGRGCSLGRQAGRWYTTPRRP
jgi:dynein heavy chain